jgi:hypothetical protein
MTDEKDRASIEDDDSHITWAVVMADDGALTLSAIKLSTPINSFCITWTMLTADNRNVLQHNTLESP